MAIAPRRAGDKNNLLSKTAIVAVRAVPDASDARGSSESNEPRTGKPAFATPSQGRVLGKSTLPLFPCDE